MFSKPLIVIAEHYKVPFWMGVEVILKECFTKYCYFNNARALLFGKTAESASTSLGLLKYSFQPYWN